MSIRSLTYRVFSLLEAPKISPELLWDLVWLFAGLGGVYLLLIFKMRNRISARREAVKLQKRELAPMISNFLFYQHEAEDEDRESYIRMKIEIRELLKVPLNREVMTEILMDLRMDVSGEARERLFQLFQDLGLDRDSFRKLESWRWERVSQGIVELTEMHVEKAYPFIRKFVNDRRGVIRKQAQLATVMLREEGIAYFLDTARYRISEWQQLKLLEILRQREAFNPPRFRAWLTSENRDVVLFALRLIRYYRQNDAELALVTLLRHRSQVVRAAALECIREFRFQSALEPMKALFAASNEELKLLILDTLGLIATEAELGFLESVASADGNFVVRSKARAVMNLLKPDSALPMVGPHAIAKPGVDAGPGPETPASVIQTETTDDAGAWKQADEELSAVFREPMATGPVEAETDSSGFTPVEGEVIRMTETGATAPDEQEDEAVFDVCFLEELEDILSELNGSGEEEAVLPLDFLPLVTEASEPAEADPENYKELEVRAEWVAPHWAGHRYSSSGISEAGTGSDRLNTEFLPWVVSGPDFPEPPDNEPSTEPMMSDTANSKPEGFSLFWEPLFELDGVSQPAAPSGPESYFHEPAGPPEEGSARFSIFREFFREYDTESRLLLLEHIAEVGEEKEWEFLCELLQDPEPVIRVRAGQMLKVLGQKLGLDRSPAQQVANAPASDARNEDLPAMELNFTPESALAPCQTTGEDDRLSAPARRWGRWRLKRKSQSHG